MNYCVLATLIAEVIFLSRLDRKIFGTWLTPFTLLGYPYTAVVVLAFIFAPLMDFVPLYTPSILIWIVGLFIFWLVGFVLGWGIFGLNCRLAGTMNSPLRNAPRSETEHWSVKWAMRSAWAITPILILGFLSVMRASGGWTGLASPDFRDNYSFGLHGHLLVFGLAIVVVLIGTYRRGSRAQLLAIVVLMLFAVVSRVKGTMFQPVIGGLIFRVLRGSSRLSLPKIMMLIPLSFCAFILIYVLTVTIINVDAAADWNVYRVVTRHYFFYLFAGPLCLGEAIRTHVTNVGGEWYSLFSPLINVCRVLVGFAAMVPAGSSLAKGMIIDFQPSGSLGESNVYTFFGTPYLYLGAFGGMLYIMVVSLLCYGLFIYAKTTNSEWALAGYSFVGAQLVFGFFELYFWYLTSLEVVTYSLLFALCEKFIQGGLVSEAGQGLDSSWSPETER